MAPRKKPAPTPRRTPTKRAPRPTATERRQARKTAAEFAMAELETVLWDRMTEDPEDLYEHFRSRLKREVEQYGPLMAYFDEVKDRAREAMEAFTTIAPTDVGAVTQCQMALREFFGLYKWLEAKLPGSVDGVDANRDEGDEATAQDA